VEKANFYVKLDCGELEATALQISRLSFARKFHSDRITPINTFFPTFFTVSI